MNGEDENRIRPYRSLAANHDPAFGGDDAALAPLVDEGQRTLDYQIQSINDIDDKAALIVRVNLVLVGVVLTAVSLAPRTKAIALTSFLNVHLFVGFAALLLSTATAALTYTASDYKVGVSRNDVRRLLDLGVSGEELDLVLANSDATWIRINDGTDIRNALTITMTIFFVLVAVTYLVLGVYAALPGRTIPLSVDLAIGSFATLFLVFARFHRLIARWVDELAPIPTGPLSTALNRLRS